MLPDQRPTKDVLVMDRLFKKATARAQKSAFSVRGAIMIQKDGWLAMVDKNGNVVQWVMELKRSKPAKRSKAVRAPAK